MPRTAGALVSLLVGAILVSLACYIPALCLSRRVPVYALAIGIVVVSAILALHTSTLTLPTFDPPMILAFLVVAWVKRAELKRLLDGARERVARLRGRVF